MKIHFFRFETSPSPGSKNFEVSGGAFIQCWVKSDSARKAEQIAREVIESEGWDIVSLEEYDLPEREWYLDVPDSLEMFDQALRIGGGYIIYSWSPEPQDDDTIH